jgi:nicotinate-nucleotide adenylyltransferase
MIRTGIFGGSFNPVHNGHLAIADAICQRGLVDELWLMVSPQNPLKENTTLMDDDFRLRLAQIATKGHPHIKVSDFEFHLPRPSYTYNTLLRLKEAYPERRFTVIIGADNWTNFSKWYKADTLIRDYDFIVYPRQGYSVKEQQLPPNVHLLDMPLYNVSSTEIRRRLSNNENISDFVDANVEKEIKSFLTKQQHKRKSLPDGR